MKSQFQCYSSDAALASVGVQHQHTGIAAAFAKIGREQVCCVGALTRPKPLDLAANAGAVGAVQRPARAFLGAL